MGFKRDLDVQENERNEPKSKKLKVEVKNCAKCGKCKSLDQYSVNQRATDGLYYCCKSCDSNLAKAYTNTQTGFLKRLLSGTRESTKERNKQGRKHTFTLTMLKLKKMITDQCGKCAISGAILVFKRFSDNQASVDRIDDNLGYVDGNCRLICLEFNTAAKWSRKLLLESIVLSGIPPKNFEDETSDLESVVPKGCRKGTVLRKWTILTENGIETVFCHHCSKSKPREHFYKQIWLGCKACNVQKVQQTQSTWRGALKVLIADAKKNTERRNKSRSEDDRIQCTLTYLELVGILKAQGGMCAYSRVAMSPRMGDWKVSLERKDVRLGYREYAVPATYAWSASGSTQLTTVLKQREQWMARAAGAARSS